MRQRTALIVLSAVSSLLAATSMPVACSSSAPLPMEPAGNGDDGVSSSSSSGSAAPHTTSSTGGSSHETSRQKATRTSSDAGSSQSSATTSSDARSTASSDVSSVADTGVSSETSSSSDVSSGTSSSVCANSTSGATCNTLSTCGLSPVVVSCAALPAFHGGTMVDGTYALTTVLADSCFHLDGGGGLVVGSSLRGEIEVADNGGLMQAVFTGLVGSGVTSAISVGLSTSGSQLTFDQGCGDAPLPRSYNATATTITFEGGTDLPLLVFTKM